MEGSRLFFGYKKGFSGSVRPAPFTLLCPHMATQRVTVDFLLKKLGDPKTFTVRAMFGEYALYADGKVVALICDDLLYVKILPQSTELAEVCEQGSPYPGAKPYYLVSEDQLSGLSRLGAVLKEIAQALPVKKPRKA